MFHFCQSLCLFIRGRVANLPSNIPPNSIFFFLFFYHALFTSLIISIYVLIMNIIIFSLSLKVSFPATSHQVFSSPVHLKKKVRNHGDYLCKYVNQRFVVWNTCETCNCTICPSPKGGVSEKVTPPQFVWPCWSVPVCFFSPQKHWKKSNLFMLCFSVVSVYYCMPPEAFFVNTHIYIYIYKCIYIYIHYWLKMNKSCKTEPNNQFICCVLYSVVTNPLIWIVNH